MLSFKPAFSLSSFTLIKRFFSSSSFSAFRVVSSAFLWLLIFLPAILTSACYSSTQGILHDVLLCELNKPADNKQPCLTPFLILNQSIVPCKGIAFLITFSESGTSLVVQWLRLYASNTGALGLIVGQGTRSHMHQQISPVQQLRPNIANK